MTTSDQDTALERELDGVTGEYIDLQISCMLLQHAACMEMKKNDQTNGLAMLEAARDLRDSLADQLNKIIESVGEAELNASYERIGLEKVFYSSLSDAVLKSNTWLFEIAPRPQGPGYACDEAACEQKVRMAALEYFPELLTPAA